MQDTFDHFHEHVQTLIGKGEYADAVANLKGGLSDERTRYDALLWLGIVGLHTARPDLAQAALSERLFSEPTAQALLLMAQTLPAPAAQEAFLHEAYRTDPTNTQALTAYLTHLNHRIANETTADTHLKETARTLLTRHATHLADANAVTALAPSFATGLGLPCSSVWQHGNRLVGWCISADAQAPTFTIHVGQQRANVKLRLAQQLPTNGHLPTLYIYWLTTALEGIRASTRLRVEANNHGLMGSPLLWQSNTPPVLPSRPSAKHTVTVLVPVYKGYAETLACIDSVLASQAANATAFRLVVVNDASPDIALIEALQQRAASGALELHHQAHNQGFIGTVNHGLHQCAGSNVILLNADTLVHGDWVDRLHATAYSHPKVASVTPLSNNGELMSLLAPCEPALALTPSQLAALDTAAALANAQDGHQHVTIDTGCGFCLYLRSDALAEQGGLDPTLTRGYGEESDWCYRAHRHGRQHLGALNVVVAHQGGVSFGDEKRLRVKQNLSVLTQRYPYAEQRFNACLIDDPMQPGRYRLIREWLRCQPLPRLKTHEPSTVALWPSVAHAKRHLANADNELAMARTHQRQLTLCGSVPHPWRLTYQLPEQRAALEADLHALGVTHAMPSAAALSHWLAAVLPSMAQAPMDAALPKPVKALTRVTVNLSQLSEQLANHGGLVVVAGQSESLQQPALTQLANTLAKHRQATYLLLLTPASHAGSALISSGHVFTVPLTTSRWEERVRLCQHHLPLNSVLLLDTQPATLADARWLAQQQSLPWLIPEHLVKHVPAHAAPHGVIPLPSLMSLAVSPSANYSRQVSGTQA